MATMSNKLKESYQVDSFIIDRFRECHQGVGHPVDFESTDASMVN
jgi:hypothetical protein